MRVYESARKIVYFLQLYCIPSMKCEMKGVRLQDAANSRDGMAQKTPNKLNFYGRFSSLCGVEAAATTTFINDKEL